MWKKLLETVQEVLDIRRQLKAHDKRLDEISLSQEKLARNDDELSDRVLRLEMQLAHQKEQQAKEGEIFRLQLENTIMRMQRGLPPRDPSAPPRRRRKVIANHPFSPPTLSLPHFGHRRGEQTRQYSFPHATHPAWPSGLTMCN